MNRSEAPAPLAALWHWLSTWIAPDGGVNGPVVHRADLKRMFAIHDTPWTQYAVISGLLELYRRSGREHWLACAARLGDAQCTRQEADGRFRWAGHEDDRLSSLVHNALADCALLQLAAVGDARRRDRYVAAAERNLEEYVVGKLYRPALQGFAVAPVDHYAGRDRFVVNMNSLAIEALVELDRRRGTARHTELVRTVGERIRSLHGPDGPPYSDLEPELHIPLYTALSLRGLAALEDDAWAPVASRAVAFLQRMQDAETGLWCHKLDGGRLARFPIFVAGAGIVCNGLLDAARLTGTAVDGQELATRLLRYRHPNGAIRNFVGYDHPDNGRRRGKGAETWEDVYPTPGWNAQAFHFLSRVLPPPEATTARGRRTLVKSRRFVYFESERVSAILGVRPWSRGIAALYVKRRRHGLVAPSPHAVARRLLRR